MPKIGMRIIKSAIAVNICCVICALRGGMPFYSSIAAVLCMQKESGRAKTVALNRMIGTCIGGVCGYLALLVLKNSFLTNEYAAYTFLSLCIIPLMYITVLLHKQSATYITCVVFLCVTITHGADVSPGLFALNRVIDTFIGIIVSLLVNKMIFEYHDEKEIEIG